MQLNSLSNLLKEITLITLTLTGVYLFSVFITYTSADPGWSSSQFSGHDVQNIGGIVGAYLADYLLSAFGYAAFFIPIYFISSGMRLYRKTLNDSKQIIFILINLIGFLIMLIALSILLAHPWWGQKDAFLAPMGLGGISGNIVVQRFLFWFGHWGAFLFGVLIFFTAFTGVMGMTWRMLLVGIGSFVLKIFYFFYQSVAFVYQMVRFPVMKFLSKRTRDVRLKSHEIQKKKKPEVKVERYETLTLNKKQSKATQMTLIGSGDYKLPDLGLLKTVERQNKAYAKETLEKIGQQLELKLADFGLSANVVNIQPGPVVTRFELDLASGIKVNKIVSISKDLARALAVISVRVVEVIPNKTYIGIEIPNQNRELVSFKELLLSQAFSKSKSTLPLALGKDISGKTQVVDLSKMPHLLVAGTTGSGKSVGINTMIASLLYRASPESVRLIMIDPKMLELSIYDGIPHLLSPVVTNMQKAANVLKWCVAEMERRYQLLASQNVRSIESFNQNVQKAIDVGKPIVDPFDESEDHPNTLKVLPFIVVVIDEFADLIMVIGKPVEELVARLAQKARAAGVHLIIATQRPSVNVITGLIKANIPTRIAFQVSSKIDSRTILDQMGAETLLGKGDMLYLPSGSGFAQRIHGAFLSDQEVLNIVKFLKTQPQAEYQVGHIDEFDEQQDEKESSMDDEPLYQEALSIVKESGRASISGLQRRLKVGYNRAARMIDEMEKQGIVSAMDSRGNREVL